MPSNPGSFGAFGPTTNVWDVTELQQVDVKSPEFKELLVRLYQNINLMNLVLQVADKGVYQTEEFLNGQIWFPNPANNSSTQTSPQFRQDFRRVVNMRATEPSLPNSGTIHLPHHIPWNNANMSWTRIYGVATNPTAAHGQPTGLPLPYAAVAGSIELNVDDTYVNITTTSNRTMYTVCYVVLEYLYQ
jgi:hypothetical protein